MKLVFGVIDQPYSYTQQRLSKSGKVLKRGQRVQLSVTTGDVAEHLEDRYKVFETFFREKEQEIADKLAESMEGAIESLMLGGPPAQDPFGAATSEIEDMVKHAITSNDFDWKIAGVPTAASGRVPAIREGGINHRLAHPYARSNPPRPSFVDTGNFESSIKVWIE